MEKKIILIAFIVLISCGKKKESSLENQALSTKIKSKNEEFFLTKDSMKIIDFSVETNLSNKAFKLLKEKKESVMLLISFSGIPRPLSEISQDVRKRIGPDGLVNFPSVTREIKNVQQSNIFKITDIYFPKEYYDALAGDKKLHININIVSGRNSLKDNVLKGELLDVDFNQVLQHGAYTNLNAQLINEN